MYDLCKYMKYHIWFYGWIQRTMIRSLCVTYICSLKVPFSVFILSFLSSSSNHLSRLQPQQEGPDNPVHSHFLDLLQSLLPEGHAQKHYQASRRHPNQMPEAYGSISSPLSSSLYLQGWVESPYCRKSFWPLVFMISWSIFPSQRHLASNCPSDIWMLVINESKNRPQNREVK